VCTLYAEGSMTVKEIAAQFDISERTVHYIVERKRKQLEGVTA
jgi:DNA-binding CsgD family transcriptional regulator